MDYVSDIFFLKVTIYTYVIWGNWEMVFARFLSFIYWIICRKNELGFSVNLELLSAYIKLHIYIVSQRFVWGHFHLPRNLLYFHIHSIRLVLVINCSKWLIPILLGLFILRISVVSRISCAAGACSAYGDWRHSSKKIIRLPN